MKGFVALFVGVVLLAVAVVVYVVIDPGTMQVQTHLDIDPETTVNTVRWGVSGFLGLLGLLFLLVGIKAAIRGASDKKRMLRIMQTGIESEGTVTYFDRNFSILVQQNPIYAIIEYTWQDDRGRTHMRRVETFPAELAIRNQVQVGVKIRIKVDRDDPSQSVIVIQ